MAYRIARSARMKGFRWLFGGKEMGVSMLRSDEQNVVPVASARARTRLYRLADTPQHLHRCPRSSRTDRTLAIRDLGLTTVIQSQDVPEFGEEAATPDKHSYGQILKSSAVIGFSTVVNLAIGVVRTKAMAVWLGPAGFGLMGLFSSIADLAQSIVGMGINASGVRQIAEAVGTGDTERIARPAVVLRRTAIFLGVLGAALLFAFSQRISILTFGTDQHSIAVKLLAATVFFSCLSGGQAALIQGMRRISDLVRIGGMGAGLGTNIGLPIICFLRENGVVPSLLCGGLTDSVVGRDDRRLCRSRVAGCPID